MALLDPQRFTEENKGRRLRFSYFPFGAGARQCIGEGLAWMEGVLILAFVARHWKLSLPPGSPRELPLRPAISLRPKGACTCASIAVRHSHLTPRSEGSTLAS